MSTKRSFKQKSKKVVGTAKRVGASAEKIRSNRIAVLKEKLREALKNYKYHENARQFAADNLKRARDIGKLPGEYLISLNADVTRTEKTFEDAAKVKKEAEKNLNKALGKTGISEEPISEPKVFQKQRPRPNRRRQRLEEPIIQDDVTTAQPETINRPSQTPTQSLTEGLREMTGPIRNMDDENMIFTPAILGVPVFDITGDVWTSRIVDEEEVIKNASLNIFGDLPKPKTKFEVLSNTKDNPVVQAFMALRVVLKKMFYDENYILKPDELTLLQTFDQLTHEYMGKTAIFVSFYIPAINRRNWFKLGSHNSSKNINRIITNTMNYVEDRYEASHKISKGIAGLVDEMLKPTEERTGEGDSKASSEFLINDVTDLYFVKLTGVNSETGDFFPYIHLLCNSRGEDLDLSHLQIYNEEQLSTELPMYRHEIDKHCLVFAIEQYLEHLKKTLPECCDLDATKITSTLTCVEDIGLFRGRFPRKKLKSVAETIKSSIFVHSYDKQGQQRKSRPFLPKPEDLNTNPDVHLAYYEHHYFAYLPSKIVLGRYEGKQPENTLALIKIMDEMQMFEPSDILNNIRYYNVTNTEIYELNVDNQIPFDQGKPILDSFGKDTGFCTGDRPNSNPLPMPAHKCRQCRKYLNLSNEAAAKNSDQYYCNHATCMQEYRFRKAGRTNNYLDENGKFLKGYKQISEHFMKKQFKRRVVIYSDSEAYIRSICNSQGVDKTSRYDRDFKVHHPMSIRGVSEDEGTVFEVHYSKDDSIDLFKNFLIKIAKTYPSAGKIQMYFHNLKYDWRLIRQFTKVEVVRICQKEGIMYEVVLAVYIKQGDKTIMRQIHLRDSYKLIPKPLAEFPSMFNLDCEKKELILYNLYTYENKEMNFVTLQKYTGQKYESFMELVEVNDIASNKVTHKYEESTEELKPDQQYWILDDRIVIEDKTIDLVNESMGERVMFRHQGIYEHKRHVRFYLEYDCLVLRAGMIKMREIFLEKFKLDIHDFLTISSIAHQILSRRGVYDGTYMLAGIVRQFAEKAIMGGRTCTGFNTKHYIEAIMQDLDVTSMYPAATAIMNRCVKGPAKLIQSYEDLERATYYIVKIKAKNNTKEQQIPFPRAMVNCVYTNEDGKKIVEKKLMNTNLIKNQELYVDKITLEDWVEFCGLEYKVLEGIFWDEGYVDNSIGEVIRELFELRNQAKAEKNNALQEVYKLVLNSTYGKTIVKRSLDAIVPEQKYFKTINPDTGEVVLTSPADNFLSKNIGSIKGITCYGNTVEFKVDAYSFGEYNLAHVGCQILSQSKRIINKVLNICDDHGIKVRYQDTDSLQIIDEIINGKSAVKRLEELYLEKYGENMMGKQLGQFHGDFNLPGATNIVSTLFIGLGKKSYLNVTEGESIHDKNIKITGLHFRMKGISLNAFYGKDIVQLYKDLYEGKSVDFDLATRGKFCLSEVYMDNGNGNPLSDFNKSPYLHARTKFLRKVYFPIIKYEQIIC